jgi:hypothetical protein
MRPHKYPPSYNTSSEEPLQTASSWLQECLSKHKACNQGQPDVPWYPTRLLDLGISQQHQDSIRLVQTAEELPQAPYATLSHRWGDATFLQLTKATMSKFSIVIALLDLPRTFREAILVARRLGIRYIWIDSLCIMQDRDDLTDWYHEASTMDQVYMQAICNISATDATDASEGLFRDRHPHHIRPAHVHLCLKGIDCSSELIECTLLNAALLRQNIEWAAVGQRGWILQEKLLARRVLHFSSHQLFWECREHQACERYPDGLPGVPKKDGFKAIHDYSIWGGSSLAVPVSLSTRDDWAELVHLYTSMSLTDPNDRLIALSGIAKARAAKLGDVYIAGMWLRDLAHQLLWHASDGRNYLNDSFNPRPAEYRAPSWSWASIERTVYIDHKTDDDQLLYHVDDISLTHATDDITGGITDGWLQLRGCLKPTRVVSYQFDVSNDLELHWSLISNDLDRKSYSNIIFDAPPQSSKSYDEDNAESRLFFIPAIKRRERSTQSACGLLLRVVDVGNGTFERLGYTQTGHYNQVPTMLADIGEEVKKGLPCLRYEDGLHTIRIV